jgi:DnaJ-class molecular chaperone
MTDHYQTLGVSKQATADEIKKAYRKMASQHHPDKGGDTAKFQEIEEAYRTLSDPEKRQQYDNPQPQFNGGHFGGEVPPGFEDIFSQMMGGGSPFGDMFGRRGGPRNRHLNLQASISLEEAFTGKELIANVTLPSGREQMLEIKIPAGIQEGTTLRLAGMGDDSYPGIPRGDIHLTVSINPHTVFQRKNDDLVRRLDINCIDAMLGKNVTIDTIDGKTLEVAIMPGTQNGQLLAAQGYGMPNMHDSRFRGRMLMEIHVTVPRMLTDLQKEMLKKHFN